MSGDFSTALDEVMRALRPGPGVSFGSGALSVEAVLPHVLEICRRACRADAALVLDAVDAVTAVALASAPPELLPDGATSTTLLARPQSSDGDGSCVYYLPAELPRSVSSRLRGAVAVLFCGRLTGACALVVVRRSGEGFEPSCREFLASLQGLLSLLVGAQAASRRTEELAARFDAMVLTLPHGLIFVDDSGAEAWVNETAAELLSLPAGLCTPAAVAQAMSLLRSRADNRDEIAQLPPLATAALFQQPGAVLRDARFVYSGPPRLALSVFSTPIAGPRRSGRVWLFMDVTAQHFSQQDLKAKNAALEEARQQADAANRAKSRFLAAMSHEIRTPMNGVMGMAGLLLGTELTTEQRDCAETIARSSEALLSIINDILDFSKIEAGFLSLETRPLALRRCIEDVLELLRPRARSQGIGLELSIDAAADGGPSGGVIGDVTRLRQVLLNLIGNAVKFTHKGRVAVEVTRDSDGKLHVCVRDTGIGISTEQLSRLFQPFSQADVSTTRSYGGTGLGLAISKRLVELMGGQIWVDSQPGVGSAFHFTIVAPLAEITPPPPEPVPSAPIDVPSTAPPLSILLVEDNTVNQTVARLYLKRLGYESDLACNGLEALAALEARPYDVVLMDVQMPELDGLEATRRLRAMPLLRQPHVIAMTAGAMTEDQQACLAAGMNEVITKPFKAADLGRALARCAERKIAEEVAALAPIDLGPLDAEALAQVQQVVGNDAQAFSELVREHVVTWDRLRDTLGSALSEHDFDALRRTLHSLAGCTGFFGEKQLSARIAELSAAVREARRAELPAIFEALSREYDRVRDVLSRLGAT